LPERLIMKRSDAVLLCGSTNRLKIGVLISLCQ
jgi:hypothetical protein